MSKPIGKLRIKQPTQAWMLKLWNDWYAENQQRFLYPLIPWKAGNKGVVMRFQGLNPDLTFEISLDGTNNGIYFSWEHEQDGYMWDCLCERDLLAEITRDGLYYCGYCLPEFIVYYPSLEALWQRHVFEELLTWSNENLKPDRVIVPFSDKPWALTCGACLKTRDDALQLGWTNQALWVPVVFNDDK